MAYKIAGGTKWWQVRAGKGVEAEWIVMKKDYKGALGRDKEVEKERSKGKGKEKKEERRQATVEEEGEGMVGEDGGEDENGDCELK